MKNYSIVRIGNEYVVQAGEKSVLKIASRRRAAQLVTDATGLLDSQSAPQPPPSAPDGASISCDPWVMPDPPWVMPDPPWIMPDPPEVP
jgi:hypothetical protein